MLLLYNYGIITTHNKANSNQPTFVNKVPTMAKDYLELNEDDNVSIFFFNDINESSINSEINKKI